MRHAAVLSLAIASAGCSLKLDTQVTGVKPETDDTIVVHVVSEKGADLTCSNDACDLTKVPASGEVDLEVKIPTGETKKVFLSGKKGMRKKRVVIDLAAESPRQLVVKDGRVSCLPDGCSGSFSLAPSSELLLRAAAGTVVEIGSEKFTVPASGTLIEPLNLSLTPPLQNQPLAKLCVGYVSGSATSPTVVSTTMALTLPSASTGKVKVDLDAQLVEMGLAKALANIESGPVLFPWEKAGAAARGKRAAVYVSGDHCYDAGTTGATVGDLDVVALSSSEERVDECTYHVTDGTVRKAKLTLHDESATVYDRITGRKLGAKKFLAPKDCDDQVMVTRAISTMSDQSAYVNSEVIAKWAATFAR